MRWFPVLLLAYLLVGLQAGLSAELRFYGIGPNLGLIAAVFVAINAPREQALLACLVIGGMQDLATQQAPGLFALSFGLVGWFICGTQQVVVREHPFTHVALTLLGGIITAVVVWLHGRIIPAGARVTTAAGANLPALHIGLGILLGSAVYTAILAPILLAILQRFRRLFGFHSSRRSRGMGLRAPY